MSRLKRAPGVIVALGVAMWAGGCACCRDHLLIHIESAESKEPLAGAKVEIRPMLALLPPPVWRGVTDAEGNLSICVDLGQKMLGMEVLHEGYVFGMPLNSDKLAEPGSVVDQIRGGKNDGDVREVRLVLRRREGP